MSEKSKNPEKKKSSKKKGVLGKVNDDKKPGKGSCKE